SSLSLSLSRGNSFRFLHFSPSSFLFLFLSVSLSVSLISLLFQLLAQRFLALEFMSQDGGRPLPKFGEWDVNDPASAEGFTVIFNKARDEKKTGGKPESPGKGDSHTKGPMEHGKPPAKKWFCCIQSSAAEA
ncbi:unnamed protein product, partial [Linum tenue]